MDHFGLLERIRETSDIRLAATPVLLLMNERDDEPALELVIAVIQHLAVIIQQALRLEDSLCYLGNGEFYILFSATNGIGAAAGVKPISQQGEAANLKVAGKSWPRQ